MQDRQDILGELFRLIKFQGDAAESQIQHTRPSSSLIADHRIRIGSDHRYSFRFALHGVGNFRFWNRDGRGKRVP